VTTTRRIPGEKIAATPARVIIAKFEQCTELASGITTISSIGGQTCNPYDPDRLPGGIERRERCGGRRELAAIAWASGHVRL